MWKKSKSLHPTLQHSAGPVLCSSVSFHLFLHLLSSVPCLSYLQVCKFLFYIIYILYIRQLLGGLKKLNGQLSTVLFQHHAVHPTSPLAQQAMKSFLHMLTCSASDEIVSTYAHLLSQRWNCFLICAVRDEIASSYAQQAMKSFPRLLSCIWMSI